MICPTTFRDERDCHCPECAGIRNDIDMVPCDACRGAGEIYTYSMTQPDVTGCSECLGKGMVERR